jgi:hypothetical protein
VTLPRCDGAVTTGRHWIFPLPEFVELAAPRWSFITEGRDPEVPVDVPGSPGPADLRRGGDHPHTTVLAMARRPVTPTGGRYERVRVNVSAVDWWAPLVESWTDTVKVYPRAVSLALGVPRSSPSNASVRPLGSRPDVIFHR